MQLRKEPLKVRNQAPSRANRTLSLRHVELPIIGAVLCLKDEIAPFNIKTCTLVIGHFRTEIISPEKLVLGKRDIPDYEAANKIAEGFVRNQHSNQPGDPVAAAVRIVDAVRSEGTAHGKEIPSVLPLGQDALDGIRKRCRAMLDVCSEWEAFATKTTTESL